MSSITCIVTDDFGNGLPGQDVWLRRAGLSNFGTNAYQMTDVPGEPGSYEYSGGHVTDDYKVWVNGTEDRSYGGTSGVEITRRQDILLKSGGTMTGNIDMDGNRIINLPNPASDGEAETQGSAGAKYLLKTGGTLSGPIDADGQRITNLPYPASDGEAETQGSADSKFLKKTGGTMTGQIEVLPAAGDANPVRKDYAELNYAKKGAALIPPILVEIYNLFRFRYIPQLVPKPVGPFDITNVKFVKDYVNDYLHGIIPAIQQTETMIIIDFNGTQEDNRRYLTLTAGINQANSYATANLRVVLFIEGSGNNDGSLLPDYNKLPVSQNSYIDIVGIEQSVILIAGEENYTSTNLGENIIGNVTFKKPADESPTGFTKKILRNVKFTSADGAGQFDLTDCIIENCSRENCTVTTSGCIGRVLDITNSQEVILHDVKDAGGAYEISYANGDIRGRRQLGRQCSDAASAEEIVLTEGNYCLVTGTADITFIRNTGWTDGSVITLEFGSGLTLINGVIGDDPEAGIVTKTGADKAFAAGELAQFILTGNRTFWKEL